MFNKEQPMILRYARESKDKSDDVNQQTNLTIGKEYISLGFMFSGKNTFSPMVIIMCDNNERAYMFELSCFDIISHQMPDGWIFYSSCDLIFDRYRLEPKEFKDNFWSKFNAGGEEAIEARRIVKEVLKKMQEFHGILTESSE